MIILDHNWGSRFHDESSWTPIGALSTGQILGLKSSAVDHFSLEMELLSLVVHFGE